MGSTFGVKAGGVSIRVNGSIAARYTANFFYRTAAPS
jgi:hypothetical protein